jgi:uracil-DNA glycosylase
MSKRENIEKVLLQKEIFGDELFIHADKIRRTQVVYDEPVHVEKVSDTIITFDENLPPEKALEKLYEQTCNCQNCRLGSTRNKYVFGVGNPKATVMLIGEGPGADEDAQGEPFVGRAGKLLNDILKAIKFEREEVYIANIVKCRPPGNRVPSPDEVEQCIPYLYKQIDIVKPQLILCLGTTAANCLLQKKDTLGRMRSNVFAFRDIKVMVTYHPAALLRNPGWKRDCWTDVQAFRKLYDELENK